MKILRLEATNFRNIKKAAFSPSQKTNIFIGENGQGKTNLLEAVCLFNGEKSFRRAKESDFLRFGAATAELTVSFFSQGREQTAVLRYGEGQKAVFLNGIKKTSSTALHGTLCLVVFSPDDLRVIKDGPEGRRALIDTAVTQLVPSYGGLLRQYERAVFQRNNLLRSGKSAGALLDVWDERLSQIGFRVQGLRAHYIDRITPFAKAHYRGISDDKEELSFLMLSSGGKTQEEFFERLKKSREKDFELGSTSIGPHRDDLELLLDNKSARFFGSQGQQRSAVLAMKLSEADVLGEKYGEKPVLLLDDVLSELDTRRQEYLIEKLKGYQVFLTCCEPHKALAGRLYAVENGKIKKCKK